MDHTASLGELIHQRRTALDLSQVDLASTMKVSESSIRNWEARGDLPSARNLQKLAEALKVDVDTIQKAAANTRRAAQPTSSERLVGGAVAPWEGASTAVDFNGALPQTARVSLGMGDVTVTFSEFEARTWDGMAADPEKAASAFADALGAIEAAANANDWKCAIRVSTFFARDNGDAADFQPAPTSGRGFLGISNSPPPTGDDDIPF